MKTLFCDREIRYDGTQLSSHFAYRNFSLEGDSAVAFEGPADVRITEMVDIEDVKNNEPISSDRMLHFIVEVFDLELKGMVCFQRLITAMACEELNRRLGKNAVIRKGDDLFYDGRKLSVSIATASPVSVMVHFAMNVRKTGAPIPVSCLEEMNIDPKDFGNGLLRLISGEYDEIGFARVKVNWVK